MIRLIASFLGKSKDVKWKTFARALCLFVMLASKGD